MSSVYDKLRRILQLEREQDYRDRAVIGGLGRYLAFWAREARSVAGGAPSADEIVAALRDYDGLSAAGRARVVGPILGQLEALDVPAPAVEEAAPPPSAAPDSAPEAPVAPAVMPASAPAPAAAPARSPRPPSRASAEGPDLSASVVALKGVSTITAGRLERLDLRTIRDLLYHLPRRYDDYGNLKAINRLVVGEEVTIVAAVRRVHSDRTHTGRSVVRVALTDGTGTVEALWFNQPYLARRFVEGGEIVVSGRVDQHLGRLRFSAPEWEPLQRQLLHTGRLVPVYPLTEGLSGRWLRRLIRTTLDQWAPRILDPLPEGIRRRSGLMELPTALEQIHFPDSQATLAQARERLAFDELLLLQLGVLRHRQAWQAQRARALVVPHDEIEAFTATLPFQLTGAQRRAVADILADLSKPVPMCRLLQGDVGSGKTIVAVIAALAAARNGLQVAVMAPTAILAEQHHITFARLLEGYQGIHCALLVSGMPAAERARAQAEIAAGQAQVIVGTHALIQEAADYARLGLVVVDEQHRFGVEQRAALRAKGDALPPHLLTMTATPIPRTLALTVYGDLDVSVLGELPPGRQPVVTVVRDHGSRERIYAFVRAQIKEGRQAFIICPLVEESEHSAAKSAVAEHQRLQEQVFTQHRVGLLHGRLSAEDKERAMAAFRARDYDIMVSTSVVEVGVDVPNATVMLVEGAERFGLAQLHQFRGRVGRGEHQSYCILLSDDPSEQALERLRAMEETNDGFALAEKDLALRGPGQLLGVRQSGLPELRVARLGDMRVLDKARREAQALLESDPDLAAPDHAALAASVAHFWAQADMS
ncbi:MAG: ATP-dependent DNA helicase RecG [Chloroflexota bacterium]